MNCFKDRLLAGEALMGFHISMCDPITTEIAGNAGFDYVWIDTEHSAIDYQSALMHIIAARASGVASLVRVAWSEPHLAKRILEMGSDGIIFPMINTREDADRAMDACVYPPAGKRGFGPLRASKYGMEDLQAYIEESQDRLCRFIQIEHADAVNNLEDILENPYIDGCIIGPCDLSGSIGELNQVYGERTVDLIEKAAAICKARSIPIGISIGMVNEDEFRFWQSKGMQFISAGSDFGSVGLGARTVLNTMRAAVE